MTDTIGIVCVAVKVECRAVEFLQKTKCKNCFCEQEYDLKMKIDSWHMDCAIIDLLLLWLVVVDQSEAMQTGFFLP